MYHHFKWVLGTYKDLNLVITAPAVAPFTNMVNFNPSMDK